MWYDSLSGKDFPIPIIVSKRGLPVKLTTNRNNVFIHNTTICKEPRCILLISCWHACLNPGCSVGLQHKPTQRHNPLAQEGQILPCLVHSSTKDFSHQFSCHGDVIPLQILGAPNPLPPIHHSNVLPQTRYIHHVIGC